jgi:AcrR family transcriptional regulator
MNVPKRAYRMVARAEAAEETRRSIIDATVELFRENDPDDIALESIAARAGVTLQTVLRRFGSKDRVFAAAAEDKSAEIVRSREPERGGPRAAVRALVASYEHIGELSWRLLRFEAQNPTLHAVLVNARALHREWIERVFADALPGRGGARERAVDALFAVTDFYVWKLNRIDLGRSRAETEATMLRLVEAVIARLGEGRGR